MLISARPSAMGDRAWPTHRLRALLSPVWLLSALLACGALAGGLGPLRSLGQLDASLHVEWWMLAPLFFLAEVVVVHLHFRRDANTVALGEVPLILGLYFATPRDLIMAQLVGAAVALILVRRQSVVKLAFNLSLFALQSIVAVLIFRAFVGQGDVLGARGWVGTLVAAVAAGLVSCLAIAAAVTLTSGQGQLRKLPRILGYSVPVTMINSVATLAAVRVLWHDTQAVILLAIPFAALAVAYRAYLGERQKHERVRLLYESSRAFHTSRGVDASIATLLTRAREMFRADIAELTLLPTDSQGIALRFRLAPGDDHVTQTQWTEYEPLSRMVRGRRAALVSRGRRRDPSLAQRGIRDAMMASISGDGDVFGTLLVANPGGGLSTFDREDLALLETFTGQASVSIENGRLQAELQHLAFQDSLTGLANRALLSDRIEHALQRRDGGNIAVLFLDLDDFKTVNDSLGHIAGDALLGAVAERVRGCLRSCDTAARLGGDEFAILIEGVTDIEAVTAVAERIITSLRGGFNVLGSEVIIHGSIGIVVSGEVDRSADELLASADVAMYRAKARGKDCFEIFEQRMQEAVMARHLLKLDLQRAIESDALEVHYQPIVSLRNGAVTGVEALVRWNHPTRGMVSPDLFIPLAEETGLIVPLGRAVLEASCRQAARWRRMHAPLVLSVNLSGRQLQQPGFAKDLADLLINSGLPPQALVLEITERVMVGDDPTIIVTLEGLRTLGVRVAIDDFGTGYSSLSCLRDLPVDILKIAKPFVDSLGDSDQDLALATAIVQLGESLDLELIAEGIESSDQVIQLTGLRCRQGQGYFYSRAVTAEEFTELLRVQVADGPRVLELVPAAV